MAAVNIFINWAGRIVFVTLLLAVCDSFTEAMGYSRLNSGYCHHKALFQSSTKASKRLRSSGEEVWIEWNQHLYLPQNKTKMTWENADLECKRRHQDAHLVYIESKEENDFVFSLAYLYDDICWIGLSDEDEEGSWKWGKMTAAKYKNWGRVSSEPNGGIDENCAGMFLQDLGPTWFDIRCTSKMYFLCERALDVN